MPAAAVEAFRRTAGRVGAYLPETPYNPTPADVQRAACRRLEAAGYRIAWTNELIGKDSFAQLGMLLAATERMAFGTCIANVWARPPQTAYGASALLAGAYPGRFVLGLGVGYPQQAESVGRDFGRPLATMRSYLAAMDATAPADAASPSYARIVGANGPKMLALAAELTDGALPAGSTPAETARVRGLLGPDRLLVTYLDASAGQGSVEQVAATVQEHLDAGADHVIAGAPFGADFRESVERLERLAPVLVPLV